MNNNTKIFTRFFNNHEVRAVWGEESNKEEKTIKTEVMSKQSLIYLNSEDKYIYLYPEAAKQIKRDASVRYTYLEEETDLVFRPVSDPQTLYHYCSIKTMSSILENRCLWMTNCRLSNDSKEMLWTARRLEELINDLRNSELFENISNIKELRELAYSELESLPKEYKNSILSYIEKETNLFKLNPSVNSSIIKDSLNIIFSEMLQDLKKQIHPTFFTCFSAEKDSLSQWFGYGEKGEGIAIGFNKQVLQDLEKDAIRLMPVVYHGNIQRFIIRYHVVNYFMNPETINYWAYHLLPTFKPVGFREEKEWRLIYIPSVNGYLEKSYNKKKEPYYKLPLTENFISEIVIGPKCDKTPEEVFTRLKNNGFNIDKEKIVKSSLSYR